MRSICYHKVNGRYIPASKHKHTRAHRRRRTDIRETLYEGKGPGRRRRRDLDPDADFLGFAISQGNRYRRTRTRRRHR